MSAPTPLEVHTSHHRRPAIDMSQCHQCRAGWETCRRKKRYDESEKVSDEALAYNVENQWGRPLVAYRCPYCTGWHLATAKTAAQTKRVRKMREQWEAQHGQESDTHDGQVRPPDE